MNRIEEVKNDEPVPGELISDYGHIQDRHHLFNPQKIDERVLQRVISDPLFRQRFVLQYGREELDNILVPKVRNQNGGTCYAHACTCILMLVLSRIVGRRVPSYEELSQEIINQFGTNGCFPERVFDHFCPRYQLRWTEINITETKQFLGRKFWSWWIFQVKNGCNSSEIFVCLFSRN